MNKPGIIAGSIVLVIAVALSLFFFRHLGTRLAIILGVIIGLVIGVPVAIAVDNLTDEYVGDE